MFFDDFITPQKKKKKMQNNEIDLQENRRTKFNFFNFVKLMIDQ